jgi:hypothetical protein
MDDWLGERFRQYAARVRCLNIQDRIVQGRNLPIRRPLQDSAGTSPSRSPDSHDQSKGVRSLTIRSTLAPNVMLAWLESAGANALFPRLRHVKWAIKSREDLRMTRLILRPHLTILTFVPSPNVLIEEGPASSEVTKTAGAIVDEAMAACPSLRDINLFGGSDTLREGVGSPPMLALPPSITVRMRNLRVLHCGAQVSDLVMQHIAQLPHMTSCRVVVSPTLRLSDLPAVFPAVHDLHLWRTTLDHAYSLLSSITSPAVHVLELCPDPEPLPAHYGSLFRVLVEHASLRSLQRLVVAPKFWKWQNIRNRAAGLPVADLMPLLCLADLRHVTLKTLRIKPDDALIQCLDGKVWPNLEMLYIGRGLCTSLSDLDRIVRVYPGLQECAVAFDVSREAKLPDAGIGFTHHGIRHMHISIQGPDARLAAGHRALVACYLINVFPRATFGSCDDKLLELLSIARSFVATSDPWTIDCYEEFAKNQDSSNVHVHRER